MGKVAVYKKTNKEGVEESYAFKNIGKTVILGLNNKVKLSEALSNSKTMTTLINMGYGGLVTGEDAEKAVKAYNENLPASEEEKENAEKVEQQKLIDDVAAKAAKIVSDANAKETKTAKAPKTAKAKTDEASTDADSAE